jgi:signal transduction histidine kinase/streptogramin lyase
MSQGLAAQADVATALEVEPGPLNSIRFRDLGVDDGLPQSSVTGIVFDEAGYLWGATFGGLFTYDGDNVRSISMTSEPFLVTSPPSVVSPARGGGIWVGRLGGGLARLEDGRVVDSLPTFAGSTAGETVIHESEDATVWVVGDSEPRAFTDQRWYTAPQVLRLGWRTAMVPDGPGAVLVGARIGVLRLRVDRVAGVIRVDTVSVGQTHDVLRDRSGRIWAVGDGGLRVIDRGRVVPIPGAEFSANEIVEDRSGRIWMFGDQGVIVDYTGPIPEVRPLPESASGDYRRVITARRSPDGVIFAGLEGGGLRIFSQSPFRIWDNASHGLPFIEATSVVSDGQGGLFTGSQCSGIFHLNAVGQVVEHLWPEGACAFGIARDGQGRVWVGDTDFVRRFDPRSREYDAWSIREGALSNVDVKPVLVLPGDTILFGTEDGRIGIVTPQDDVVYPTAYEGLTESALWSIALMEDGTRWFGSVGEVVVRRPDGTLIRRTEQDGIPAGQIRVLEPLDDGGAWVGSYGGGLIRLHADGRTTRVDLIDPTVLGFYQTPSGGIWLLQNTGLVWLNAKTVARIESGLGDDLRVTTFGRMNGVSEGNSGRPAVLEMEDGWVAFATVSGLIFTHRLAIPRETPLSRPVIDVVAVPDRQITFPERIELQPTGRYLRAHVGVAGFQASEQIKLRYRLRGRDRGWIDVSEDRWIELAALRPGRYQLNVEAALRSGEWVPAAPLEIDVVAVWTEWRWLRATIAASIILLIATFIRLRFTVVQQREEAARAEAELIERAARERERHQRELARVSEVAVAGELSAALLHELGQPLGAMVNDAASARVALARVGPVGNRVQLGQVETILNDISSSGERVSRILSDLRGFFKEGIRNDQLVSVNALVRDAVEIVVSTRRGDPVRIEIDADSRLGAVRGDRSLLLQALMLLLTNALEALDGVPAPKIFVRTRRVGRRAAITVSDNGPGIPASLRGRVFEPFVTAKKEGMGLGLAICKRIAEGHGGTVAARNCTGGGAVFRFTLPLPGAGAVESEGE